MNRLVFIIATVILKPLTLHAGITVNATTGIVESFTTTTTTPDLPAGTTFYFYEGSYNTVNAGPGVYHHTDTGLYTWPNSTALEYGNELRDMLITYENNNGYVSYDYMYYFWTEPGTNNGDTQYVYNVLGFNGSRPWTSQSIPDNDFYDDARDKDATTITPYNSPTYKLVYYSLVAPISGSSDATPTVPEPSTAIAMGLLGVVGFAGNRRRRRQVSAA